MRNASRVSGTAAVVGLSVDCRHRSPKPETLGWINGQCLADFASRCASHDV